jgi:hypothetical protein
MWNLIINIWLLKAATEFLCLMRLIMMDTLKWAIQFMNLREPAFIIRISKLFLLLDSLIEWNKVKKPYTYLKGFQELFN